MTTFLLLAAVAGCTSETSGGEGSSTSTTAAPGPSKEAEALATRLEAIPKAKVEGPITGGKYDVPYLGMPEAWFGEYGYTEDEYFLSGDATAYEAKGTLSTDGKWDVAATDETAPFTTRVVVRRPADPAEFNGTLVVEWLNVSAGRDSDPDFGFLAQELLSNGYAYASVSAQKMGVEPGGLGIEIPNVDPVALAPLKTWDPERYGDLSHPGDPFSYDIFGQAARTVAETGKGTPLGDLDVERVIAVGESQSAFRLTSYVDAIQPTTNLFDGFLTHSRGIAAADIAEGQTPPNGTQIRTDIDVPVFQFETETDLEYLEFVDARQDDHEHLVTWETAGTAHADRSTLDYAVQAGRRWTDANVDLSTTCGQVNEGPQQPIVQAAFDALHTWVVDGTKPPTSPRLETDDQGAIVRDADGIAQGGIRTPPVDAPTSVLTGTNPTDSVICSLFGSTTPLTPEQLAARYPDHEAYVADVTESANAAVADGFLLQGAADDLIAEAQDADVP
ncbi:MAG: alpha/beta hydrolase domain-containing protein [Aquihabitans sp.]